MSTTSNFATAHRQFSAGCFNAAWELIDKESRTKEEDLLMIDLAHASVWHWRQRTDCEPRHLVIGYWQLARVYALEREPNLARRYGCASLALAEEGDSFNRAFAHEALARAEMVAGNVDAMNRHLEEAGWQVLQIADQDEAAWVRRNLETIR